MIVKTQKRRKQTIAKVMNLNDLVGDLNELNLHFTNHMSDYYTDLLKKGIVLVSCLVTVALIVI